MNKLPATMHVNSRLQIFWFSDHAQKNCRQSYGEMKNKSRLSIVFPEPRVRYFVHSQPPRFPPRLPWHRNFIFQINKTNKPSNDFTDVSLKLPTSGRPTPANNPKTDTQFTL
ncbi:hypothetical protein AC249_AIPGENE836 [Exaiptasia diaphana]|nr:hypothetical protein AC249_AIPGENE836 [Exaiptasia diaphana]